MNKVWITTSSVPWALLETYNKNNVSNTDSNTDYIDSPDESNENSPVHSISYTLLDDIINNQEPSINLTSQEVWNLSEGDIEPSPYTELYQLCKMFIADFDIQSPESVYQRDDIGRWEILQLVEQICNIVGYSKPK